MGLIYCPASSGNHPKLISHAANPLPVLISENTYRVFFSGRDEHNRSSVGAVDIDVVSLRVLQVFYEPFFTHGPPDSFYADGVSIGNCYEARGQRYMLFMGWQTPGDRHWRGDIGRLIVTPDLKLELADSSPFIASDSVDPLSLSYPWVVSGTHGTYEMWYGSTLTWHADNGEMIHVLNRASSSDGDTWVKHGLSIPYEVGVAQAFSRPTVIRDASGYHMWFSYRSGSGVPYRIGYAESTDGLNWLLKLASSGIDVSNAGWDSEMIEYPAVLEHKGQVYMFYNGNGYGRSGFGMAVLE